MKKLGLGYYEYVETDYPHLHGLSEIPDALVDAHLKLYSGYVKNVNRLNRSLGEAEPGSPAWSELHRRMGFELNGMRLHELYFENLKPGGASASRDIGEFLSDSWESVAAWEKEFRAVGAMRGVGWAILYRDPSTDRLSNHWIDLHQNNHPAGFTPILLMDVWEHAYTGMERARYIDAFFANLDWEEVEARLKSED
ncbi:MAG TPA: Fe-Mn family superoxide dismutase [Planctomycetota bacterium]|nr:Fe-Mn family superoxide dismutase [Planctomycetota bacterium]